MAVIGLAVVTSAAVLAVYVSRYFAMVLLVGAAAAVFASVGTFAGRLQTFALGFYVFTATVAADIPFTPEAITGGTRPGLVIWVFDLSLIVLITLLLVGRILRTGDARGPPYSVGAKVLITLFLGFIGWEFLSALGASQFRYAIFQVSRDLMALPIFLAIMASIRTTRDVRFVCLTLLAAFAFHVVFAAAQILHGGPFGLSVLGELHPDDVSRDILQAYTGKAFTLGPLTITNSFSGLVGASYRLAALGVLLLPFAFVLGFTERHRARFLLLSLTGVGMVILSLSRGSWAGLLVAILTLIWLLRRRRSDVKRRSSRGVAGGLLVLVALSAVPLFTVLRTRLLATNLGETTLFRVELIRAGLKMLSNPFLGIGPNNFAVLFEGIPAIGLPGRAPIHNIYALLFVETGVVGLAVYLLLLAVILRTGIRLSRRGTPPTANYAAGITAGIVGLCAWGVVTWLYRAEVIYTIFWILTAVLFSLERLQLSHRALGQKLA